MLKGLFVTDMVSCAGRAARKAAFVVLAVAVSAALPGCSGGPRVLCDGVREGNGLSMARLGEEGRQAYVRSSLMARHPVEECIVSEVSQRQVSAVENEDYYFATADVGGSYVSVWVSPEGVVSDTYFLIEEEEAIAGYFKERAEYIFPGCEVKVTAEMRGFPFEELGSGGDVGKFLMSQPVYVYVRVFAGVVSVDTGKASELRCAFGGVDGQLYIYACGDMEGFDAGKADLQSYGFSCDLVRGW